MPYVVNQAELGDGRTPSVVESLFVELWVNVLESRTPMLLGPPPFSLLSLLGSIRHALAEGSLYRSTIARQVEVALALLHRLAWVRTKYPQCVHLEASLTEMANAQTKANCDAIIKDIGDVLSYFSSTRVSSHVDFILELGEEHLPVVADEVTDFISDLIALGHSESFLYGWGRAIMLSQDPLLPSRPPLDDRFLRLRELGCQGAFSVVFKAKTGRVCIPHSDAIVVGKNVVKSFTIPVPWTYNPGEDAVLVRLLALDYKAAIEKAVAVFTQHTRSLCFSKALQRVDLTAEDFLVKRDDGSEEWTVPAAHVRPYEPPPLIQGNAIWVCKKTSPDVVPKLEQTLFWLASSRGLRGEAEFITLWLALVSLFDTDDVKTIQPLLARYRLLARVHALADWIADYVGKAFFHKLICVPNALVLQLSLKRSKEERLAPLIRVLRTVPALLEPLAKQSPLLRQRISELTELCCPKRRHDATRRTEMALQTLLPWVHTVRDSVAHLGSASTTSLDLANQHLVEDVSLVYDQVCSSAIGRFRLSIGEIHRSTLEEFDNIMQSVIAEPCLSVLHVRQNLAHTEPRPRKRWVRRKDPTETR